LAKMAETSQPAVTEPAASKKTRKPKLEVITDSNGNDNGSNGASPLIKPDAPFSLDRFKSKRDKTAANVEIDPGPLPVSRIVDVKDFVRVHHDEENFWSDELTFISVPIKGMKKEQLHIIDQELAVTTLEPAQILWMRLALASKPDGKLFLAQIPSMENMDNTWNSTHFDAIRRAQKVWLMAVSRAKTGEEGYEVVLAKSQDAFKLAWGKRTLLEHIERSFKGRIIMPDEGSQYGSKHEAFLRKIGAEIPLK
jgi:hypothetical protein